MRQKLPDDAPYPLVVRDIAQVVHPGEEFDCPLPVPGCLNLDPPGPGGDAGPPELPEGGSPDSGTPPDDPQTSPGSGRARTKGNRP